MFCNAMQGSRVNVLRSRGCKVSLLLQLLRLLILLALLLLLLSLRSCRHVGVFDARTECDRMQERITYWLLVGTGNRIPI